MRKSMLIVALAIAVCGCSGDKSGKIVERPTDGSAGQTTAVFSSPPEMPREDPGMAQARSGNPVSINGEPEPLPSPEEGAVYKETRWPNGRVNEQWHEVAGENGQMVKHGIWRQWYEDGSIKEERHYEKGVLQGTHTQWYTNGQKILVRTFRDGEEVGSRTMWKRNGELEYEGELKNRGLFKGQ